MRWVEPFVKRRGTPPATNCWSNSSAKRRTRGPRRQELLRVFKRLLRKLGLKERSFHSLRYSFLSRLVRRGASVEAVRMLAGHSSLTVTERYVHATAGDLRGAIRLLH